MAVALVAYADGSEDMEVTAVASVLARGGVEVVRCAVNKTGSKEVTLSHGTRVICDLSVSEAADRTFDMIVLPGGLKGAENCAANETLTAMLKAQKAAGRYVAAICAAPGFVLDKHGIIGEAKATGYPGCSDGIKNYTGTGTCIDADAKIVTGKGPAFAIDFGLACLSVLVSAEVLSQVKSGMLYE